MHNIFQGPPYDHPPLKPGQIPPATRVHEPDSLFSELFGSSDSPAAIARIHNLTVDTLLDFAASEEARDKLRAFSQLAHDRAELLFAEARVAAAHTLLRCLSDDTITEKARKAASVVLRTAAPRNTRRGTSSCSAVEPARPAPSVERPSSPRTPRKHPLHPPSPPGTLVPKPIRAGRSAQRSAAPAATTRGRIMKARRGFALWDLVFTAITALLILALFSLAGTYSRRNANLGQDINKLHDIAAATGLYAAEFKDHFWGLSWQGGTLYNSPWPELNLATDDMQAQANQAVEILRRAAGRTDIPRLMAWIPHILYNHLPLVDFLGGPFPWLVFVSSGDVNRLRWASDPACHDLGCFAPCQSYLSPSRYERRWPYSASFQMPPAFWDRSSPPHRVSQVTSNGYGFGGASSQFSPRMISGVAHPAEKVLVFDEYARHFGREVSLYFNDPAARLPLVLADGHAHLRPTAEANPGWLPNEPNNPAPTRIAGYTQRGTCLPGTGGNFSAHENPAWPGVFKWTRSGIAGRDFGPEVWEAGGGALAPNPLKPELIHE